MFAFASLIDAGESKRIQNPLQDNRYGEQPNPSNLKTQWDKKRSNVGGSPEFGVLIHSLAILRWILTEPLVCTCVILNGPNFSPSNLW